MLQSIIYIVAGLTWALVIYKMPMIWQVKKANSSLVIKTWLFMILFATAMTLQIDFVALQVNVWFGIAGLSWLLSYRETILNSYNFF